MHDDTVSRPPGPHEPGPRFADGSCGRPCPVCGSTDTRAYVSARHAFLPDRTMRYARCAGCDSLFLLDAAEDDYARISRASEPERAAWLKHYLEIGAGPDLMARAVLLGDLRRVRNFADVGGGVGLAADFVNRTLGDRVTSLCFEPSPYGRVEGPIAEVLPAALDRSWLDGCPRRFDLVLASEVIEHVDEPARFAANLRDALGDTGGCVVITTPDAAEIAPEGRPLEVCAALFAGVHRVVFSRKALAGLLREAGLAGLDFVDSPGRIVVRAFRGPAVPPAPEAGGPADPYLEYLRAVVAERGSWDESPYTAGLAFRLFKEEWNRERFEEAGRLLLETAGLRRCLRPGSSRLDPAWLEKALDQPDFASYVGRCPAFLGPLAFRVALLENRRSGATGESRAAFEQALLLLENERRLSPILFAEAAALVPVCLRELAFHSASLDRDDGHVELWDRAVSHAPGPASGAAGLEELIALLRIAVVLDSRGEFARAVPVMERLRSGRYDPQPMLGRDGILDLAHVRPEHRKLCCDHVAASIHREVEWGPRDRARLAALVHLLARMILECPEVSLDYAAPALALGVTQLPGPDSSRPGIARRLWRYLRRAFRSR